MGGEVKLTLLVAFGLGLILRSTWLREVSQHQ